MSLPPPDSSGKKHKRTFGESAFDWMAYGGFGFAVNAYVSVLFADWVHNSWKNAEGPLNASQQRAKATHDFIYNTAEKMSKPLEGVLGKGAMTAEGPVGALKQSRRFMQGAVLGIGGWAMLVPIKIMEDHKADIVRFVDKTFGTGPKPSDGNAFKDYNEHLDNQPKQTWGSEIGGRTIAFFTPLFIALPILDVIGNKMGGDPFEKMTDVARNHGFKFEEYFKNAKKPMTVARGKEWTYNMIGEAIFTAIGVTVLYMVSKMIANAQHKQAETDPSFKPQSEQEIYQGLQEYYANPENAKRLHSAMGQAMQQQDKPASQISTVGLQHAGLMSAQPGIQPSV